MVLTHLMKQIVVACQQLAAQASAASATNNEAAGVIGGVDWNKRRRGGLRVRSVVFAERRSQLFLDGDVTSASLTRSGRRASSRRRRWSTGGTAD